MYPDRTGVIATRGQQRDCNDGDNVAAVPGPYRMRARGAAFRSPLFGCNRGVCFSGHAWWTPGHELPTSPSSSFPGMASVRWLTDPVMYASEQTFRCEGGSSRLVAGLTLPDEPILLDQDTGRTEARSGDPVPGLNFSCNADQFLRGLFGARSWLLRTPSPSASPRAQLPRVMYQRPSRSDHAG